MSGDGNEGRTRVVFNLPMNHWKQHLAAMEIIGYLKDQQIKQLRIDGFTHSEKTPPVYAGYWWDATDKVWVQEALWYLWWIISRLPRANYTAYMRKLHFLNKTSQVYTLNTVFSNRRYGSFPIG
jgi:hypothetical protein